MRQWVRSNSKNVKTLDTPPVEATVLPMRFVKTVRAKESESTLRYQDIGVISYGMSRRIPAGSFQPAQSSGAGYRCADWAQSHCPS